MRTLACLVAAGMLALSASVAGAATAAYGEAFDTLYRIDLAGHTATEVGRAGSYGGQPIANISGLSYSLDETLYAVAGGMNALARIDAGSGAATIVGSLRPQRPGRSAAQRRARSRHDVRLRRHALARLGVRRQALDGQSRERRDDAGRRDRPHDHRARRARQRAVRRGRRAATTISIAIDTKTGAATIDRQLRRSRLDQLGVDELRRQGHALGRTELRAAGAGLDVGRRLERSGAHRHRDRPRDDRRSDHGSRIAAARSA